MSGYIQGSKPGQYGYALLNRKEEAQENFVNNYNLTPESSIISAYKRFLESGLDTFFDYYGVSMFLYGEFKISIYSKKMKLDYDTDREYGDNQKFLIMEVDWEFDRSKWSVYNSFVDDANDYIDFNMMNWEYLKNNPTSYYAINEDDYYHKIAAELKGMSQLSEDQGTLIFCCELPIYESDEKIESIFEEKVMNRIDFFFRNLIDEDKSSDKNKLVYSGKINRNELIKFRDEELARINARLLEFGKSR